MDPLALAAVALGLLIGGLLFWRWHAGAASRAVLGDALVAVRPLILPLLLIVFLGAVVDDSHIVAAVTVGVVVAAIAVPWLRSGEWGSRRELGWHVGLVVAGTLVGLGLSVWLVRPNLPGPEAYEDVGGAPTAIAIGATIAWAAAALLRGLGFARTPWRLIVAALVVFAGARVLLATGALGTTWNADAFPSRTFTLVAAGIGFAICVIAEGALAESKRPLKPLRALFAAAPTPARPWRWAPFAAAGGLMLTLVSTLLLTFAFGFGWAAVKHASEGSTAGLPAGSNEERPLSKYSQPELALAFLPVLRFDRDARWNPQPVETYLAAKDADLTRPDEPDQTIRNRPTLNTLPDNCDRRWVSPCYTLTLHCDTAGPIGEEACAPDQGPRDDGKDSYQDGAVYARVVQAQDDKPYPFQDVGPPDVRTQLHTLIQYWFFYTYDEWVAPVLGGRIVQRHEGDWEAVTVGLGKRKPLFVAFSEHCGGTWQRWHGDKQPVRVANTGMQPYDVDIAVSPSVDASPASSPGPDDWSAARARRRTRSSTSRSGRRPTTRPRSRGARRTGSTCQGIPGESVALLSYVWNIRDRTGTDYSWLPSEVKLVDENTLPMSFPGTWGARDTIQYATAFSEPEQKGGQGPRTPPGQPLWSRPVHRIFCERGWHGPTDRRDSWNCDR